MQSRERLEIDWLLDNARKYAGEWVIIYGYSLLGFGNTLSEALEMAGLKGSIKGALAYRFQDPMKNSDGGLKMINSIQDQLLRDEGVKLKPYRDTRGKLTIGVGRNLDDDGITYNEAMYLFDNDVSNASRRVEAALPWAKQLDDIRYAVLVNLAFNMGIGKLLGFKHMLDALHISNWSLAHDELLNSNYAKQVGERAQRLAKQILTGEWQ